MRGRGMRGVWFRWVFGGVGWWLRREYVFLTFFMLREYGISGDPKRSLERFEVSAKASFSPSSLLIYNRGF